MPTINIYRLPQVIAKTGLSRSSIYAMVAAGRFPKQIKLGPRRVGWVESEIVDWIDAQVAASRLRPGSIEASGPSKQP